MRGPRFPTRKPPLRDHPHGALTNSFACDARCDLFHTRTLLPLWTQHGLVGHFHLHPMESVFLQGLSFQRGPKVSQKLFPSHQHFRLFDPEQAGGNAGHGLGTSIQNFSNRVTSAPCETTHRHLLRADVLNLLSVRRADMCPRTSQKKGARGVSTLDHKSSTILAASACEHEPEPCAKYARV